MFSLSTCAGSNQLVFFLLSKITFHARLFPEVLRKDWNEEIPNVRVLGNLPFNVSTPLIIRFVFHLEYTSLGPTADCNITSHTDGWQISPREGMSSLMDEFHSR